jgi:hypothetical protein
LHLLRSGKTVTLYASSCERRSFIETDHLRPGRDRPLVRVVSRKPRPARRDGLLRRGPGGKHYVNCRTANAFALKRRLDPHRDGHVPFYCGGIAQWPELRQEITELRNPAMEVEEARVKQVLEDKETFAARLQRSPDLLDALLMTFSFSEQE